MTFELHNGKMEDVLLQYPAGYFDSCVSDFPYGLSFMGKSWDYKVPSVAQCLEIYRALKPGAYLLAFGGPRTYHRIVCNIEDAGFEIRDQISWVFGSGFPKSSNQKGEWKGWGSGLKPAHEPICVARKPLIGTIPKNLSIYGTGALNIEGCKIGESNGRWPANLIHDGSDEVLSLFPESPGQLAPVGPENGLRNSVNCYGNYGARDRFEPREDLDKSAARFFYSAKASRKDRNEGCEHMAPGKLNWSSGEKNPGSFQSDKTDRTSPNNHPTVKPTALMRYLVRLVTRPGGHVLDPFCGSGSTGKACMLENMQFTGIDIDPHSINISECRISWAHKQMAI